MRAKFIGGPLDGQTRDDVKEPTYAVHVPSPAPLRPLNELLSQVPAPRVSKRFVYEIAEIHDGVAVFRPLSEQR